MSHFLSQYDASVPVEWRSRACGVTALKMALGDLHTGTLKELIEEGVERGAWQEPEGYWKHAHLAQLAHHYGLPAYNEEFRDDVRVENGMRVPQGHHEALGRYGLDKLKAHVEAGKTVLVSVPKHFEIGGSFHMVLLTGFADGHFVYHDSSYGTEEEGANRRIEREEFFTHWRRLAIFTGWF